MLLRYSPKNAQTRFFTLKSFLSIVQSQFVFLHILWNLGNVFKGYNVVIGDVENFLRAKQVGKSVKHYLCFEAWISKFLWDLKKTAQARVFHFKIISTRRTIPICFPRDSLEPGQCFKKLQRGHRRRRKFSKGRTSREVGWAFSMLWSMNFEISMRFEENCLGSNVSL